MSSTSRRVAMRGTRSEHSQAAPDEPNRIPSEALLDTQAYCRLLTIARSHDTFSGRPNEDVDAWLDSVKATARTLSLQPSEQVGLIRMLLREAACSCLESLPVNKEQDLDAVIKCLLENYSKYKNKAVVKALARQCTQQPHESVAAYFYRFTMLFRRAGTTPEASDFINGLQPKLREEVAALDPQDLLDAKDKAAAREDAMELAKLETNDSTMLAEKYPLSVARAPATTRVFPITRGGRGQSLSRGNFTFRGGRGGFRGRIFQSEFSGFRGRGGRGGRGRGTFAARVCSYCGRNNHPVDQCYDLRDKFLSEHQQGNGLRR